MDEIITMSGLFVVGIFSSMFGTLVGGAAFLTIPFMNALGIPLTIAISSNAIGNIGLNLGGFLRLKKSNFIHYKLGILLAFFAFLGSILGSYTVIRTSPIIVKGVFTIALFSMLLSWFARPHLGLTHSLSQNLRKRTVLFGGLLALFLGAYAGFLGAGVGILYTYGLALIFGQSFLQSTATKKIPGLTQALGAWLIFAVNGKVNYSVAVPLFLGMLVGSEIGVYYGLRWGNGFIRILLLVIITILFLKFLF